MKVLWHGRMGYRLGDRVACAGRRWEIDRIQKDTTAVFPTKYMLRSGDITSQDCVVVEVVKEQIRHAGTLIEIGRDGRVLVLEQ